MYEGIFKNKREETIFKLRLQGFTHEKISEKFNISRTMVGYIVSGFKKNKLLKDKLILEINSDKENDRKTSLLYETESLEILKPYCIECFRPITEEEYFSWGLCKNCKRRFKTKGFTKTNK